MGGPMAGPMGGAMAGMNQMAGGDDIKKQAQTWFIISCVSFFCGCGIFAAVPIFFAWKAKQAADVGNAQEFQDKVKIAKICVFIGWGLLVLSIILNVVSAVLAG